MLNTFWKRKKTPHKTQVPHLEQGLVKRYSWLLRETYASVILQMELVQGVRKKENERMKKKNKKRSSWNVGQVSDGTKSR